MKRRHIKNLLSEHSVFEKGITATPDGGEVIISPLRILSILTVVSGIFAMIFEVQYFNEFIVGIYIARLLATAVSFSVLSFTYFKWGQKNAVVLAHVLMISIISSFVFLIYLIPGTLFLNSHILSLLIFTTALFLSWDIKNQIIVAIYYNILFAASIIFGNPTIYYLPNIFAAVIFVMIMSVLSIIAVSINYRLRLRALRKSFETKAIFENVPEGIFRCTLAGKFFTVNPAFVKILGYSSIDETINNCQLRHLFKENSEMENFFNILNQRNSISNFKANLKRFDNSEIIVALNVWLVNEKTEKSDFYEGTLIDITEKEKLDRKIKEYNNQLKKINANKDKFFSIVAHDLKTPFTALLGYTEIIEKEGDKMSGTEIQEFASSMNDVAKKTYNLLENLLEWSRIQTGRISFNPAYINLFDICQEVIDLLNANALRKNIKLLNEIPQTSRAYADKNMVYTILRNLYSNSIKFTDAGGFVKASYENINGICKITVEDNGIGISREKLNKLFKIDVHYTEIGTENERGTGLGLILCYELVNKNGGNIFVESDLGKGSKFIFTLHTVKDDFADENYTGIDSPRIIGKKAYSTN